MTGNTSATFVTVVHSVLMVMQLLVWLLSGTAITVFMFGMVLYISRSAGSKGQQDGKELIKWGLIGLFIIFSLSGILAVMRIGVFGS